MQLDINALALVVVPALITGIGALILRSWTRSDARRAEMTAILTARVDELKTEKNEIESEKLMWERRATRWHAQLLANGIIPDPKWGDPV